MIKPKNVPYKNTKVDPFNTQMDVNKLFHRYGITKFMWTSDFQVAFELETEEGKPFVAIVKAPPLPTRRRTRQGLKTVPNLPAGMRLLYKWMKSKLESIAYGMETEEKAFMSDTLVRLEDGQAGTAHQLLRADILKGKLALPNFSTSGDTLRELAYSEEDKKEEKVIDAEYSSVN